MIHSYNLQRGKDKLDVKRGSIGVTVNTEYTEEKNIPYYR